MPSYVVAAPKPRVHPLRGIGVLALLLSAFTFVFALATLTGRSAEFKLTFLLPAGALLATVAGIIARGLKPNVRIAAWCSLTLIIAAAAVFGFGQLRPSIAAEVAAPTANQASLSQTAGTIAFLLDKSGEGCPPQLVAAAGLVTQPAGPVRLPAGATFEYVAASATICSFSVSAAAVGHADWNSITGTVAFVVP